MTVGLSPEMARNAFRPLLERLENNGPSVTRSSSEARELLAGCRIGDAVLEQLTKVIHDMLRHGIESGKLQLIQREFLDFVELAGNQVYPKVCQIVAGVNLSEEERKSALETLDGYIHHAKTMGEDLKAMNAWLKRAHPSVDLSAFEGHKVSPDFDDYEDTEQIEARIRAGGEI